MNRYPRESVELVPLTVTVDGTPVTGYSVALVPYGQRPSVWAAPTTVDGKTGVMLPGTATRPDRYSIFVKVTDSPEAPVIDAGLIELS